MSDLLKRMRGISGTACSHGQPYDEPVFYEACETHHGKAAYEIAMQWFRDHLADDATVERVARTLSVDATGWFDFNGEEQREKYRRFARAALAAVLAPEGGRGR